MKVLFVCRRNNGRSQIAKGIYNLLTKSKDADAAGVEINIDGQLLKERALEPGSEAGIVIGVMGELGVDVSDSPRTQLTHEMLDRYDRVVVIMDQEHAPDYLRNNHAVEFWRIEDPKGNDINGVRETRDLIRAKIEQMLETR